MNQRSYPGLPLRPEPEDWVADRHFLLFGATLWVLGFAYPTLTSFGLTYRQMWLPLIAGAAWLIVRRFMLATAMFPQLNLGMILILAWAVLSSLWAPEAMYVLTQAISIVGISMLALAFSLAAWRPHRFESLLTRVTTLVLFASLVAGLLFPSFAVHQEDQFELLGSWKGVAYHKNGLGQIAAVGVMVWTYRWAVGKNQAGVCALGVGLSLLMLLKSRSSTSLLLAIIASSVLLMQLRPMVRVGRNGGAILSAAFITLAPLLVLVLLAASGGANSVAEGFANIFGKDATFSGRTFIWAEMLDEIALHPWLGFGFSSFWGDVLAQGPEAAAISLKLGWTVPNAHNGYLDVLNELGLIGLGLFLAFVFIHVRALSRLGRFDPGQAAMHRCLLIYIMLANLTETGWFHPITMTHVLAMYSSVEVSRQLFEHRLRALYRRQQEASAATVPNLQMVLDTVPAHRDRSA